MTFSTDKCLACRRRTTWLVDGRKWQCGHCHSVWYRRGDDVFVFNARETRANVVPSELVDDIFTCDTCPETETCEWAWDEFNVYGECLKTREEEHGAVRG